MRKLFLLCAVPLAVTPIAATVPHVGAVAPNLPHGPGNHHAHGTQHGHTDSYQ